jgi:vacuolar-type H+-ATPase subunit I/STV1
MFGRRLEKLINAQHEETMAHLRQRKEEFERLMEASERRTEETREYNREILLRNEKVYTSVIARLEKNTAKIDSSIEETRAQTQALLRLIDRFDQPGGAAAA